MTKPVDELDQLFLAAMSDLRTSVERRRANQTELVTDDAMHESIPNKAVSWLRPDFDVNAPTPPTFEIDQKASYSRDDDFPVSGREHRGPMRRYETGE